MGANVDAIEAMLDRRSHRSELPSGPIDQDRIARILECGDAAPSSKNARPWRFHLIEDRATLMEAAGLMEGADGLESFVPLDPATLQKRTDWPSTVLESARSLACAGAAIFVENTGEFSRSRRAVADVPRDQMEDALTGYALEHVGIGAAVQNMWLAVTALGLTASFIGDVLVAETQVARLLDLEGDLVGVLAVRNPD